MNSYLERNCLAPSNLAATSYPFGSKKLRKNSKGTMENQQPFALLNNFAWKYKPRPFKPALKLKKKMA